MAFDSCERFWYIQSVEGDRAPPSPAQQRGTSLHADLEGVLLDPNHPVHQDNRALVGEAGIARFPERFGGALVLPQDRSSGFKVELPIVLPTYPNGPLWKGFIDLWRPDMAPPLVLDHKTTSDFRYAKTEEELAVNPQMVAYGKWAIEETAGVWGMVRVAHLYLRTRGRPAALVVATDLSVDDVETQWLRQLGKVRRMVSLRSAASYEDITPTGVDTGHCHKYGGCPYKSKCGIDNLVTISRPKTRTKERAMSDPTSNNLLARLQRLREGKPATEEPAPPAVAAPAPAAVIPPDAPSREQPTETVAPPPSPDALAAKIAGAKKRGRPRKSPGPAPLGAEAPAIERPVAAGKAATCPACGGYAPIDTKDRFMDHPGVDADLKSREGEWGPCVTSGDTHEEALETVRKIRARLEAARPAEPVDPACNPEPGAGPPAMRSGEADQTAPAAGSAVTRAAGEAGIEAIYVDCLPVKGAHKGAFTMAEDWLAGVTRDAAAANDVADYRLINYTSRGVLATAINVHRQRGEVPAVLVVSSHLSGADVVLECLVPFARTVVRGLRG